MHPTHVPWRRPPLLLALATALLATAGCNHVTTRVPGVLDMRTDGRDAPVETTAPAGARSGFDAIVSGAGVQGTSQITIEDRKFWIIRLFPISNESATEEINQAMGKGALRTTSIGDTYTLMDWLVGLGVSIIPCGGLLNPPFTATVSGTRIKATAAEPAFEAPPAAPGEPTAPPATTAPAPSAAPGI